MSRRRAPIKQPVNKYGEDIINHETKLLELFKIQNSIHAEGEELIKLINLLHDLGYIFHVGIIRKIRNKLGNYLQSSGNNEEPISDDFKRFIKIISTNRYFILGYNKALFFSLDYNKNTVVQIFIEELFNKNFKFDLEFIKKMHKNQIIYQNEKLNQQIILDHNLIIYFILSLNYPIKINQMLFNNVMYLFNTTEIHLKYILLFIQTIKYYHEENINVITSLINNILQYNSNNLSIICDCIIKNCTCDDFVLKLFLQHNKFNDIIINKLCNARLLNNNFIYLIYAIQNNYIINIDMINKLLLVSETCKFGDMEFDENCADYIKNNFKMGKDFKLIDYCGLLNCKSNDETFNIALHNGYNYTITYIIKQNNIIPDINTLNECIKSRDIKLINNILCYKIEPTELTLENLVLSKRIVPTTNANARIRRMRRVRYSGKCKKSKKMIDDSNNNTNIINIVLLLIRNGLKITLNCVSLLLSIRENLKNLENYEIEYDESLYFECYINNYFPDEYMEKFTIDKNIVYMRTNRKIQTYKQFSEFMKINNIELDYYMLENLYKQQGFQNQLLNQHNLTPSILSMYKSTNTFYKLKAFKNFIKLNNITKEMMIQTLKINL